MVEPLANVLQILLLKYHDNKDLVLHIRQLMKVCVTNGEYIDYHKVQYCPNSMSGRVANWFRRYEMCIQQWHGQRFNMPL